MTRSKLPPRKPGMTTLEVLRQFTPCVEWLGYIGSSGYGQVSIDGKMMRATRVAYAETFGPIPEGMVICHSCDNPPCVNPFHLWLGTVQDNVRDRVSKSRGNNPPESPNNKLSRETAHEIRTVYSSGLFTRKKLADDYGVTIVCIGDVLNGVTWLAE